MQQLKFLVLHHRTRCICCTVSMKEPVVSLGLEISTARYLVKCNDARYGQERPRNHRLENKIICG